MSRATEVVLVVLIVFGNPIAASLYSLVHPPTQPPLSNAHLLALLVMEPVLAALAAGLLHVRGWRLEPFGMRPRWSDVPIGAALWLVAYVAYAIAFLIARSVFPTALKGSGVAIAAPDLALGLIVAASVVNPVFEEFFVSAYLITALKRFRSPWFAVNASIAIRLLYHLYQGAVGVVGVVPIGVVFGYWYARTGRLWPLVVAHAAFDFIGLMAYQHHGA